MHTKDKRYEMVKAAIKLCMEEYKEKPFVWTVSEIEAQVRLYSILQKLIQSERFYFEPLKITNTEAIPAYEEASVTPLRLEYKVRASNLETNKYGPRRLDICVLNQKSQEHIAKENLIQEAIECFIEVKVGWSYSKGQFSGYGVKKDLELISQYKDKGYFVYFIGNNYEAMKEGQRDTYKNLLEQYKKNIGFNTDQVFIVFRDIVVDGDFEKVDL